MKFVPKKINDGEDKDFKQDCNFEKLRSVIVGKLL
jgi:hypothetical protein